MRLRLVSMASLLITLYLMLFAAWAQGSDPETWPIVYQDNFEDPASGWLTGKTKYATRAYVDGIYEIQVDSPWRLIYSWLPDGRDYLDFTVEVDAQVVNGTGEWGILIRGNESSYYLLSIRTDGHYRVRVYQAHKWRTLVNWISVAGFRANRVNHLTLRMEGSAFFFKLNGESVGNLSDTSIRGGRMALFVETFESAKFTVGFDNLVVREDPEIRKLTERGQELSRQADAAYSAWQLQEAKEKYTRAATIFSKLNWKFKQANAEFSLGILLYLLSAYRDAIRHYEGALSIYREIGNRRGEANSLMGLGICYSDVGDYKKAIDYHEQSVTMFREIGDRGGEASSIMSLGICYSDLGDYKKAIDYHKQSLGIFREIGNRRGEAATLNNLGNCYSDLGDYKKAIDYHEQSLAIDREIGRRAGEGASLNNLGECYRTLGKIDRAMEYYNQALAIAQAIGARLDEATAFGNLGNCYREKGQYQKAFGYYAKSQEILQAIGHRSGQSQGLADLAECYLDKGDYQQAIDNYQQTLKIAEEIGTVGTKWKAQWGLGKAHWKLGGLTQAKIYYEQAIAEVEGVRSRIKVEKLEQSYTASVRDLYEEYIELLLEMGEGKDTLSADERARARSFLDALAASPAGISKKTIQAGIKDGIDSVAIENAVQSVVEESPQDSAILEYLVTNQGTLVWVIRGGQQHGPYRIPHGRKELMDKVIECRQQIEQLNPMANFNLAILYDWLILPIENLLPPSDASHHPHLIIVPSGPLYYLPFEALIWSSPDLNEHSYFIERYALSYSPSLTMIKYEQLPEEQSASKSVFVALANPNPDPNNQKMRLPEAEQEAYRVASCFPVAKVHVGADANEDVLESAAIGTQSILFAAHGMFDPNNPMYSYIALSPTDNTDGRLHAYDVFNLTLDTDTVVLSACETLLPAVKNLEQQMADVAAKTGSKPGSITTDQLVTITAGDDIVGLTRAFLIAGASSVISSLWNVDSHAAGQFMISFYHHLEDDGMTKAEALRAASLDIMSTPNTNWNLPCYWAPFELIGGWK